MEIFKTSLVVLFGLAVVNAGLLSKKKFQVIHSYTFFANHANFAKDNNLETVSIATPSNSVPALGDVAWMQIALGESLIVSKIITTSSPFISPKNYLEGLEASVSAKTVTKDDASATLHSCGKMPENYIVPATFNYTFSCPMSIRISNVILQKIKTARQPKFLALAEIDVHAAEKCPPRPTYAIEK